MSQRGFARRCDSKVTELGCSLTLEVKCAVEPAISAVLAELAPRRPLQVRAGSAVPSIWWEEKVV